MALAPLGFEAFPFAPFGGQTLAFLPLGFGTGLLDALLFDALGLQPFALAPLRFESFLLAALGCEAGLLGALLLDPFGLESFLLAALGCEAGLLGALLLNPLGVEAFGLAALGLEPGVFGALLFEPLGLEPFLLPTLGLEPGLFGALLLNPLGFESLLLPPLGVEARLFGAFLFESLGLEPLAFPALVFETDPFGPLLLRTLTVEPRLLDPLGLEPSRFGPLGFLALHVENGGAAPLLETACGGGFGVRALDLLEELLQRGAARVDAELLADQFAHVDRSFVGRCRRRLPPAERQRRREEAVDGIGERLRSADTRDLEDLLAERRESGGIIGIAERPADDQGGGEHGGVRQVRGLIEARRSGRWLERQRQLGPEPLACQPQLLERLGVDGVGNHEVAAARLNEDASGAQAAVDDTRIMDERERGQQSEQEPETGIQAGDDALFRRRVEKV